MAATSLDTLCINTIRMLSVDAVQKANSGHPGLPMEAAPMAHLLWTRFMRYNPKNPLWPDRDRFVLSAGHGSMLLYSMLHLTGYDLPMDELKRFRQWGSRTPGHPEYGLAPGVETTTGPLGQGLGNAVGMAMAEAHLAARFNRPGEAIVDHWTYVIASDGDMMEGVASEACSLAGHLRLGKLIVLYTDNHITIEGETSLAFSEDVGRRFEGYGWHVQHVADGNDLESLDAAIRAAQTAAGRPSLIVCRTIIGYGSPNKAGTAEVHGAALGEQEVLLTKQNLGWPVEPTFYVPDEVYARFHEMADRGRKLEEAWQAKFGAYAAAYPDLAQEWRRGLTRELPAGWNAEIPVFTPDKGAIATRQASGEVLNALAKRVPSLIGGSADLAPSTNTLLKGYADFEAGSYDGRNLHFGVREHAMGATLNGMTLHGGVIAYGATFLIFSDYMRPSIRLAAIMEITPIYVFTHDSVGLGEDGPTHQPIEHYMTLRAIPHLVLIRPADATETAVAWQVALEHRGGPVAILLTRQKVPILDRTALAPADGLRRGAYVLAEAEHGRSDAILIATGSEVHVALAARKKLAEDGVAARVVSMPSWELFDRQPVEYRNTVLSPDIPARLAIETGVSQGWERYVGPHGSVLGLNRFGASAPDKVIIEQLGFTAENAAARAMKLVKR